MTPEEICNEYKSKLSLYREFSEVIAKIIQQLIANSEIKVYSITYREKNVDKLKEKIIRKKSEGVEYTSLEDIEDLSGVRVVTYLDSHKKHAAQLVHEEFRDSCLSYETKYDPQGYRGTHIVLQLDKQREVLSEYARYKNLKCEIQVASILYHAWSEIEHDVIYKPGDERKKLESLGLDDIEKAFNNIMAQHLEEATIQFDLLYAKHREVLIAGKLIYSDYIKSIKSAKSNDELHSILDIVGKFINRKPEVAIEVAEEVIKSAPMPAYIISTFGDHQVSGKENEDIIIECIEIFRRARYWDLKRILSHLYTLAHHHSHTVSKKALETIKESAKYNLQFIRLHKNLYPQKVSLEVLNDIPERDRVKDIKIISTVLEELLSSSIEGREWTSPDTLAIQTGALNPSESLKIIRRKSIDYIIELYKKTSTIADRLVLIRVLLSAFEPPHQGNYGDELIVMLREDSIYIASQLENLILVDGKVVSYPEAQEIENSLTRLLRRRNLHSSKIDTLYRNLQEDLDYTTFCLLVGDIHEFKNIDEKWDKAEERRLEELDNLISQLTNKTVNKWYKKLNIYAQPYSDHVIEEWKYRPFRIFIERLTVSKPKLAAKMFTMAIQSHAPLSQEIFVTSYLAALRRLNHFKLWDDCVGLIRRKRNPFLASSIVYSLNQSGDIDLQKSIRDNDILMLDKLIHAASPYKFTTKSDRGLRYALINTLSRVYHRDEKTIESMIVEEMRLHPSCRNIYFRELPFAEHRNWLSFKEWSPNGIKFISDELIKLEVLDWHVQEMMLKLMDDPLELILYVFNERIKKDKNDLRGRYDEVPYDINPELQEFLSSHTRYIEEMVMWLRDMTPEWSTYNWNVTHFIQRIGGASYSEILMRLIAKGDKDSLQRAAIALNSLDGADFDLCFEIVKRTDDSDILSDVGSAMSGTGVVTGEDGFARANKEKAQELEKYINSDDPRVKSFASDMRKTFELRARVEYERAATDKRTRDIEYRGGVN